MKEEFKQELEKLYEAPRPQRKDAFLRELEMKMEEKVGRQEILFRTFILQQIPYVRKWNWVLSILFFVLALMGTRVLGGQALWVLAAFTPLLALAAVTESNRSVQYCMEELELAARFPLKAVVMSRLMIMGISNLILLTVCIFTVEIDETAGLIYRGAVILIPYLLSAFLNLLITRKIHGDECVYICIGVSILVSAISIVLGSLRYPIYHYISSTGMLTIFLLTGFLAVRETMKFMKRTEEYVWN